jgi:hypothetical protein|eukprot:scaffold303_cov285-Chaetoceros_neogracile.AAC.9
MKLAILATLAVTAAAFAPTKVAQTSTSLNAFETEIGAQEPLGFWDPLGLLDDADQDRFDRLRYVEIKHGRIAMLAVVGHITTSSGRHLAGNIDYSGTAFTSLKTGLAGISDIPQSGLLQIIAFIGFLELFIMKDVNGTGQSPGDFLNGFNALWDNYSDEEKVQKRTVELNQGRAAQMGILGLMVHEQIGGDPYIINSVLGYPTV